MICHICGCPPHDCEVVLPISGGSDRPAKPARGALVAINYYRLRRLFTIMLLTGGAIGAVVGFCAAAIIGSMRGCL